MDSLDDFSAKLQSRGIRIQKGPIQPSPLIRFLFIKDPDGMNLQIVEQLVQP